MAVFHELGALKLVACWGDDVPEDKLTSFPVTVQCQPDETVVLSWIAWPSKSVRGAGLRRSWAIPRETPTSRSQIRCVSLRQQLRTFREIAHERMVDANRFTVYANSTV